MSSIRAKVTSQAASAPLTAATVTHAGERRRREAKTR
jgi:hypothetical protein